MEDSNYLILDPISDDSKRPKWSVIIPTHNCAHFLKEALQSVLKEGLPSSDMEIIVVDDYSTKDNPEEVVNLFGMDRVSFIRQPKNVGKIRNYETGLKVSKGELVHLLHGDDKIRPGFYNEMQNLFDLNQEAKAGFCRSIYINDKGQWTGITGMIQEENGIVQDILDKLYVKQHIQTPSMVVKREVYESIGAFDRRLNAMEDWEMWIRVANRFPIATSNEVLAEYRSHDTNATSETFVNGTALKIHETLYGIVDAYVDKTILEKLKAKRNKNQSEFLLMSLNQLGSSIPSAIRKKMKKRIFELNPTLKTLIRISI